MEHQQEPRPLVFRRKVSGPKGRQPGPDSLERIRALLGDSPRRRDLLVEHLHRIQDAEGCLPASLLAALAQEMSLSQAEVYEVASFYHHFDCIADGEPAPPRLTIRVCESLSCAMAGAARLADALADTGGREVRVQKVPCVGRCDRAPVAIVGRYPVERADSASVWQVVDSGLTECPLPPAQDYSAYRAQGGYRLLAGLHAASSGGPGLSREQVLGRLERSGLRGLGGAGFPAARKWKAVAAQAGPRLMVVNADEGEPGTFKDRYCLETQPHRMLEGMLIAAAAVGCDACYIYLRDEYPGVRALLEREIAALLDDPPVSADRLPEIHLRRGAGAYICGEESALIESLEGKRGMPRLRPPYVAQVGLFGRPTLAHNVETLDRLVAILGEPVDAQGNGDGSANAAHGRRGRSGLRLFSVSGRVRDPGVKLAPAGISVRELIDEHCGGMSQGHELYAYLPGGASGGILPASMADLPLDFDTLQPYGCFIGSAAIIVLSRADRVRDAAINLMDFFRHESCGQCTPCRSGTAKAAGLMRESRWDRGLLEELSATMVDASICGLGQAAPNPMLSTLRWFADEFADQAGERR
jgi:formate dehydrogenase beta subunit